MKSIKVICIFAMLLIITGCGKESEVMNEQPVVVFEFEEALKIELGESVFFDQWVFGEDVEDGELPCDWDFEGVDLETPGSYTATCTVTDEDGDSATSSVPIDVEDKKKPIVEKTQSHQSSYPINTVIDFYSNIMMYDDYDTELDIVIDDSQVMYDTPGTYDVIYTVTDDSGNETVLTVPYTLTRTEVPTFTESITSDQSHLWITYEVTDPDFTFLRVDVKVEKGSEVIMIDSFFDVEYDIELPVPSNTEFKVTLTYYYDLGGNQGNVTRVVSEEIMSDSWELPEVNIAIDEIDPAHLDLNVLVEDPNGLITTSYMNIYDDMVNIETHPVTESGMIHFFPPRTNTTYQFEVIYTYDLNDGNGPQTVQYIEEFISVPLYAPDITIMNIQTSTRTLAFDMNILHFDNIEGQIHIDVTDGYTGLVVETVDLDPREDIHMYLIDLEFDNLYYVDITYQYDLHNGIGVQEGSLRVTEQTELIRVISVASLDSSVIQGQGVVIEVIIEADTSVSITHIDTNVYGSMYMGSSSLGDDIYRLYVEVNSNFLNIGENHIVIEGISFDKHGIGQPSISVNEEPMIVYVAP